MYMDFSKSIYISGDEYLDGRSIVIFDCDTSLQLTDKNNAKIMTHIIQVFTKSISLSQKQGYEDFCVIVNLTNVKKCNLTIKFLIWMTKILKEMFPEKLYKCFLRNPSFIFRSLYLAIRFIIDKETRDKISLIKNGKKINYEVSIC